MRRRVAAIAAAIVLAASFTVAAEAQTQTCGAEVRVIHASPDAGSVDILVNGQKVVTDLKYPTAAGYTQLPAGAIKVQVNATGKDTAAVGPVDVTLPASGRVTVVATGLLAGSAQAQKPTLAVQVFQDDGTLPTVGKAKVRVINASPDAAAVDVLLGTTSLATNLASAAASAYVEVDPGKYPVTVNATGTTTALASLAEVELVVGRVYTLYTYGQSADKTLAVGVLVDRAWDAQARVIHAAPKAPAIDVYLDGKAVVTNLPFLGISGYVPAPSGRSCVIVTPTGATDVAIGPIALDLLSATKSTIVAVGVLGGTPPLSALVVPDTTTAPAADKVKIRVIHASPDAPSVDVLAADVKLFENLAFGKASDYLEVAAGTIALRLNAAGTTNAVLPPLDVTLTAGQLVTVLIQGTVADKTLGLTILSETAPA